MGPVRQNQVASLQPGDCATVSGFGTETAEVVPVVRVDMRAIGDGKPGPITLQLRERFHKLVRE